MPSPNASIEDIILRGDRRGVAELRPHLPADFCSRAAHYALSHSGSILIATGFYIVAAGAPETDGPPGALALGRALESLGRRVSYVTDCYAAPVLEPLVGADAGLIRFPVAGDAESAAFAGRLLSDLQPDLLMSVERCGLTGEGTYLNMRGVDISPWTARVDHLFTQHPRTIGIGDGGNEIGMGALAAHIPQVPTLPNVPAATSTAHLVISSTSNWGAYGLLAAMSLIAGRNLLPDHEEEARSIAAMVDRGAVDGVTGEASYSVDSMDLAQHGSALVELHALLGGSGLAR